MKNVLHVREMSGLLRPIELWCVPIVIFFREDMDRDLGPLLEKGVEGQDELTVDKDYVSADSSHWVKEGPIRSSKAHSK